MRESSYVRSRRTTACGGTVFRHAEANGPGGRAPGLSDQAVTGTLAGKGFPVCWPYGQTGGGCFLGGSFAAIRWRHHLQVLAHPVYAMRYREERPLPSCISLPSSSIFLSSRYALI